MPCRSPWFKWVVTNAVHAAVTVIQPSPRTRDGVRLLPCSKAGVKSGGESTGRSTNVMRDRLPRQRCRAKTRSNQSRCSKCTSGQRTPRRRSCGAVVHRTGSRAMKPCGSSRLVFSDPGTPPRQKHDQPVAIRRSITPAGQGVGLIWPVGGRTRRFQVVLFTSLIRQNLHLGWFHFRNANRQEELSATWTPEHR